MWWQQELFKIRSDATNCKDVQNRNTEKCLDAGFNAKNLANIFKLILFCLWFIILFSKRMLLQFQTCHTLPAMPRHYRFFLKVLRLPQEMMDRHTETLSDPYVRAYITSGNWLKFIPFYFALLTGIARFASFYLDQHYLDQHYLDQHYLDQLNFLLFNWNFFWLARYWWLPRSCKTQNFLGDQFEKEIVKQARNS